MHRLSTVMTRPQVWIRACFLSLARSKLRLCSASHRPGYWSNPPCDWPSTAWAYSESRDRKRAQVSIGTADVPACIFVRKPWDTWDATVMLRMHSCVILHVSLLITDFALSLSSTVRLLFQPPFCEAVVWLFVYLRPETGTRQTVVWIKTTFGFVYSSYRNTPELFACMWQNLCFRRVIRAFWQNLCHQIACLHVHTDFKKHTNVEMNYEWIGKWWMDAFFTQKLFAWLKYVFNEWNILAVFCPVIYAWYNGIWLKP